MESKWFDDVLGGCRPQVVLAVAAAVLLSYAPRTIAAADDLMARHPPQEFRDDFTQPDGAALKWSVVQPGQLITVESGEYSLETRNTGQSNDEAVTFAGKSPTGFFRPSLTIEFDMDFKVRPEDPIGRHAGVMFAAEDALDRSFTSGYTIDWIDRDGDHGYRVYRFDNGVPTLLGRFGVADPDPGRHWKIVVNDYSFSLEVDGVSKGAVVDSRYGDGYVSLWAAANGQHVHIDNVVITAAGGPQFCFKLEEFCDSFQLTALPGHRLTGLWVNWDCSGAVAPVQGLRMGDFPNACGENTPNIVTCLPENGCNVDGRDWVLNIDGPPLDGTFDLGIGFPIPEKCWEPRLRYVIVSGRCPFGGVPGSEVRSLVSSAGVVR